MCECLRTESVNTRCNLSQTKSQLYHSIHYSNLFIGEVMILHTKVTNQWPRIHFVLITDLCSVPYQTVEEQTVCSAVVRLLIFPELFQTKCLRVQSPVVLLTQLQSTVAVNHSLFIFSLCGKKIKNRDKQKRYKKHRNTVKKKKENEYTCCLNWYIVTEGSRL